MCNIIILHLKYIQNNYTLPLNTLSKLLIIYYYPIFNLLMIHHTAATTWNNIYTVMISESP